MKANDSIEKVTVEQVQQAVLSSGQTFFEHHKCAICGVMIGFYIQGDECYFDSSCGCAYSGSSPDGFQKIADWINMQSNDEARKTLLKRFNLES